MAVDAAGGRADGNLLDDIHFGKDVPSPSKQTGNLTITKSVEGIDSSKVSSGTFSFDVENASGEVVDTITLPTESGEWSDTLISLEPGTYTVTENAEEIEGYRLTGTNLSAGSAGENIWYFGESGSAKEKYKSGFLYQLL